MNRKNEKSKFRIWQAWAAVIALLLATELIAAGIEHAGLIRGQRQAADAGLQVSVVSGDRDLLQLATDRIMIRIPKTKGGKTVIEDYYAEDVQREWELSPAQIIELKALMGDSADNIPGLPGVGQKTATKILQAYGTIENAHAHAEEIKPRKASKYVASGVF